MIDRFLNKNKKLIILCLLVVGIYVLSLWFSRNTDLFCSTSTSAKNYECWHTILDASDSVSELFTYLLPSLLLLLFVSDRLKRNTIISIMIVSVPIFYFTLLSSIEDCGGFLPLFCGRSGTMQLLRPIYPAITVLTLIISAIYFYFKDRRPPREPKESKLSHYASTLSRRLEEE